MERVAKATFLVVTLVMLAPYVLTQDKSKTADEPAAGIQEVKMTPVKVAITFVEFEGDKKVKSLPYTIIVVADGKPPSTKVRRMGCNILISAATSTAKRDIRRTVASNSS